MPETTLYDRSGEAIGTVELSDELFAAPVNVAVMHQAVTAQLAGRHLGTHDTKTRGEVRGGGRKPYRQKGTGRARQGSRTAPHYAGGVLGNLQAGGRVLIVAPARDERLDLSARNLPAVAVLLADSLNVVDVLKADTVVIEQPALARLEEVYA